MNLLRRLRFLWRHRQEAEDLAEEIELHRAMAEEAARSEGVVDAQAQASRDMGNLTRAREDSRQIWIASWLEGFWQDVRYAVRSLLAQPGFTFMAMLALVLGIGLNISLFSAINGVLLRPWNVPNADRLVQIFINDPRFGLEGLPMQAAPFFDDHARTLQGAFIDTGQGIRLDQQVAHAAVRFVSGGYFEILGVQMALGRPFTKADDSIANPQAIAVMSHDTWTLQYAGDPNIIGRTVLFDDVPFTIVGVTPQSFTGTKLSRSDLWAPLTSLSLARPKNPNLRRMLTEPNMCCIDVVARLAPHATEESARAEVTALLRQWEIPMIKRSTGVVLTPASYMHPSKQRTIRPIVWAVLGAVVSVLLLACANVSNLLLARSSARQHEIAVRAAIGAGRGRIIRQLLTEALLLSGLASIAGVALAFWLPRVIVSATGELDVPVSPDTTVLAYSLGVAILTAIFFGLVPALRATKLAQHGSRVSRRFPLRGVLLGVQVAISTVLLVAAALLMRGIQQAHAIDLGFRAEGLSAVRVALPLNRYDQDARESFFRDLTASLTAMRREPVGLAMLTPLGNVSSTTDFEPVNGASIENFGIPVQPVNPEYFQMLRMPFVSGRSFNATEKPGDAIVVNEALARLYWPDGNAMGSKVKIDNKSPVIVGIVRDSHVYGIGTVRPAYFAPFNAEGPDAEPVVIVPENIASSVASLV